MIHRSIRLVLVAGLAALALGCHGPRLEVRDAQITAFDRDARSVSWQAQIVNATDAPNLFCTTEPAEGWISVQGWFTQSTDLDDLPRLPAGGRIVVFDGQWLGVGERRDASATSGAIEVSLDGYTHLIIEAYARKANRGFPLPGDPSLNTACATYCMRVALPLP